ncbi:MAG: type I-E CRISPR-associated protein Cas7/Cse4/CasC [Pseudonocardiaceae bacterium]
MIIELHLLQSFPVSNLNRDDVGQPKTATFGSCTRGRISSQCIKRATRQLFSQYGLDVSETGVRTKRLLDRAAKLLAERGRNNDQAPGVVEAGLETLGFRVDSKTQLSEYLLFVGRQAIELLADFCDRNWDHLHKTATDKAASKEKAKDSGPDKVPTGKTKKIPPNREALAEARHILDASRVADVALFGRMITDNKDFSVHAASQVAHAISTHAVVNEFDYYTAVDDLKPKAESGADMIGTVDFNSACYYRYANLDLTQLDKNLDSDRDLVARATKAWLYAFVHAVPGGKQNSMAAHTVPETLLGVARGRGAWNLANAFLRPVTGPDLMATSSEKMLQHFGQLRNFYGSTEICSVTAASVTGDLPHIDRTDGTSSLDDFASRVLANAKA